MYLIYDCLETSKKSRRTALILPYFPWKHWSRPFYVIHWKKVLYTMMSILSCGITYDGKGEGAFIHHPDLKGGDNLLWAISARSEEHTSELQSRFDLVCRLLLEKKKSNIRYRLALTI